MSKDGKSRRPKVAAKPRGKDRHPKVAGDRSDPDAHPVWRIGRAEVIPEECDWHWLQIDGTQALTIFEGFKGWESMRVSELFKGGNPRCKGIPTNHLDGNAQTRLEDLKLDDVDQLYEFRLNGPGRVWTIREQNVFEIVWWDPHHHVCPTKGANN